MNRNRIAAFLAASFFFWSSLYVYVPALPSFVRLRTPSLAVIGMVLSMYGLWQALCRVPLGILVDATGRSKPFLAGGFLVAGLGSIVMGLGSSVGVIAFGRALSGAAAAAWVPMIVAFTSFFPPTRVVFATSLLSFSSSFAQMAATSVTGLLSSLGGYGLVFGAGGALACAAAGIISVVRWRKPESAGRVSPASILTIFVRRDVLVPSFASAITQFGVWAVVFSFLPLLARQLGSSKLTMSLLVTINIVASAASSLLNTAVIGRSSHRALLYSSFLLFGAGIVVAALGRSIPMLFVSTVAMGLGSGMFYPILMGLSIERVDGPFRSTAMGIHQAVYAIGMFTGPWIGGILADAFGIRAMFAVTAVFCVAGASLLMRLYPRTPVFTPAERKAP